MNKEKTILVAALVLVAVMALLAWRLLPDLARIGEHRREGLRPFEEGLDDGLLAAGDVAGYLEGIDPFFWGKNVEAPDKPPPSIDETTPPAEPPEPPRDLRASPGDGSVRLTWEESSTPGVLGYALRYTDEDKKWGPEPITKKKGHTIEGLENGTSYTFLLSAVGPGGLESPPLTAVAVPEKQKPPPPLPPLPPPPSGPGVAKRGYVLPVKYIGTVKAGAEGGPRKVIFKDDDGEYVRLIEGQEHMGVKVIEIRANSVILENEKGRRFTLPQGGL
jgi:hypothetical protein